MVKPVAVWSKTLRRGDHRLKSHVIDLKTQGSILAPLDTIRIVYLLHYADKYTKNQYSLTQPILVIQVSLNS